MTEQGVRGEPLRTVQIAPAGFGKTHTIVSRIGKLAGKNLTLTHTHAGVASITQKLIDAAIPPASYPVETISSIAQRFVHAFDSSVLPANVRDKTYLPRIIKSGLKVFSSDIVRRVICHTYSSVFVDEYQDCSVDQHHLIMALARNLPLHIFGDPLQAIFGFKGERMVCFNIDLKGFDIGEEMQVPWRWRKEGNNQFLGEFVKTVRASMVNEGRVRFVANDERRVHVIMVKNEGFSLGDNEYVSSVVRLLDNNKGLEELRNLLILCPPDWMISDRAKLRDRIDPSGKRTFLLEDIDDKSFYNLAEACDRISNHVNEYSRFTNALRSSILEHLFSSGFLTEIFNDKGLVRKKDPLEAEKSAILGISIERYLKCSTVSCLLAIVKTLEEQYHPRSKRPELLASLLLALQDAASDGTAVLDAMIFGRNRVRRIGRRINGRCIGSTLLTKGLEFDTVAILDAHLFKCPKNLYVALTRACKRLVIFTAKKELVFEPVQT